MRDITLYANQVTINLTPQCSELLGFLTAAIRLEHSDRQATIKIQLYGDVLDYTATHQAIVQMLHQYAVVCQQQVAQQIEADYGRPS